MISLKTRLRHFYQLRDSETWFVVRMMAVIFGLYVIAGSLDYADEQRAEAERHQTAQKATETAFLRCLNGGWVAQTETHAIVCSKAYEVSKK